MSTPFATNPGLVASQAASRQFPPRRTSLFGGGGGASTEPSPAVQEPFGGNLARDPFLTQMLSQDRPTNQRVLPQRPLMQDVGRDPFMTAAGQAQGQAWDFKANLRSEIQQGSKAIRRLLGPGDPDRTVLSRNILVAAPFLIFVWVLSMWCHLRHYSPEACVGLTIVLAVGSVSLLLQGYTGKSNSSVPLLPLGCLCLLAVSGGLFFGLQGWDYHWRQIWWSHTGSTSVARTASTPASSQLDAALIDFWESEATFLRRNDTSVDPTRGAGYKDEHFYCVAPIMSPQTARLLDRARVHGAFDCAVALQGRGLMFALFGRYHVGHVCTKKSTAYAGVKAGELTTQHWLHPPLPCPFGTDMLSEAKQRCFALGRIAYIWAACLMN
ncbi:unnamed protein product [Polarella glacialis]|uniref:Uncharacterized protein n=1 Tax=Polarella glacialis TaxID=89957 RepID=A0A813JJE2_POLGL|nr:unnamed protein product [Polarella glacialis]